MLITFIVFTHYLVLDCLALILILSEKKSHKSLLRLDSTPKCRTFFAGHAGARNCKFLERVTITDQACKGDSNWKQYAVHAQDVPVRKIAEFNLHKPELMADPPVQEMPVQSLITTPSPNDIISAIKSGCESISVKGNLLWSIEY